VPTGNGKRAWRLAVRASWNGGIRPSSSSERALNLDRRNNASDAIALTSRLAITHLTSPTSPPIVLQSAIWPQCPRVDLSANSPKCPRLVLSANWPDRELFSPRIDQSAIRLSAIWFIRELTSNRVDNALSTADVIQCRQMSRCEPLFGIRIYCYTAVVRPHLEFAACTWDPYTIKGCTQLEMVQRRAARFVKRDYHNNSVVNQFFSYYFCRETLIIIFCPCICDEVKLLILHLFKSYSAERQLGPYRAVQWYCVERANGNLCTIALEVIPWLNQFQFDRK